MYLPGHHSVSSFNYAPDIQASYHFSSPFRVGRQHVTKIIKTTGIRPRIPDLLRVPEALAEVGVKDMIMNVSWFGDPEPASTEYRALQAVVRPGFPFQITVFADALMPTEIYGAKL